MGKKNSKMKIFGFLSISNCVMGMCERNYEHGYCDNLDVGPGAHLPYIRSCSQFIECDINQQWLCDCAEGLQFNHRNGACEWPNARECCIHHDLAHRPCESYARCEDDDRDNYCPDILETPAYQNDRDSCAHYVRCDADGSSHRCSCPPERPIWVNGVLISKNINHMHAVKDLMEQFIGLVHSDQ